jgi:hypothetical protein
MKPYAWIQTTDDFFSKSRSKGNILPYDLLWSVVQNVNESLENCAVSIPPYDLFIRELIPE